jgi:hypothetical protein
MEAWHFATMISTAAKSQQELKSLVESENETGICFTAEEIPSSKRCQRLNSDQNDKKD